MFASVAEPVGPTVHFNQKLIAPGPHFVIPIPVTLNVKPHSLFSPLK